MNDSANPVQISSDSASNHSHAGGAPQAIIAVQGDDISAYNQGLTPLDPAQKKLLRIRMIIRSLILLLLAMAAETVLHVKFAVMMGMFVLPALLFAAWMVALLPGRIYRRWGYDMGDDQLRILRGYLWRTDTIVPFNRVQHIDVAQGPTQRSLGLSTLIVHTAGTHNSVVALPGLATDDAEMMRERIKGHIRQEMI